MGIVRSRTGTHSGPTLRGVTASGSWGVRSFYLGPFLLILVVAASSASTAAPIVAAALLASVAAFRASRVAVAVADGDISVRNFWMTYRVSPSEVVECARAKNSGWVGMVRWPYSVIVLLG